MQFRMVGVLLVALLLATLPLCAANDKRAAMWAEVTKAENDGLPKTAVEKLEPLIAAALADDAKAEALRAICKRIVLEGNIQGNKPEEKVTRLEAEIKKADPKLKPLMTLVLAKWYWHYFSQNRWRFMNRTATAQLKETDFTTWDLPKLFGHISRLYTDALADPAPLKAESIEKYADFLQKGNQPIQLRPTLYDFAVHEALTFYMSGEQAAARPSDAFEFNAESPALDQVDKFLQWKPETTDKGATKLRVIQLLQDLIAFHRDGQRVDAALDNDLIRLRWARNVATGELAATRYIDALKAIAAEHADRPLSALAMAWHAQELQRQGKLVEAHRIASEGTKRHPNSDGGADCRSIISQIEQKQLTIETERSYSPPPVPQMTVQYANIDEVHFRIVKGDWQRRFKKNNNQPEYLDWEEREALVKQKPLREWSAKLPATTDFKKRSEQIDIPPGTPPGFYWLLASWRNDFTKNSNVVQFGAFWMSDLAIVSGTRWGNIEGLVVKAVTGEPVPDAKITAYAYQYNKGVYVDSTNKTDDNGVFSFRPRTPNESQTLLVEALGQELLDNQALYAGHFGTPSIQHHTFIFTDRAIYRPGQTINFKAITVRVVPDDDNYEVMVNHGLTVGLRDVNGQEVSKLQLVTNEYGSVSGKFTAPTDRLTGAMQILAYGMNGGTTVRVEEYKRPKFKVTLEPPADGGKLGLPVTIKGEAMGYNGAPIDGAPVKYRITRQVRMPWWWCWWGPPPSLNAQEIDHGTTKTDGNGKFAVTFTARPDLSVPEKDDPSFVYQISADVLDSAGETRSNVTSVRIGYTALDLNLSAAAWLPAKEPVKLNVNTTTLDGKGVAAKGSVVVYSLKQPAAPVRADLTDRYGRGDNEPDQANPTAWETDKVVAEAEFQTQTDGRAELALKLPAGALRVVAKSTDRYGKEVTSRYDLTVVEPTATTYNVKQPFKVLTEQASLEPGQTARVLWGTGYDSGRAWVEVEHRNKLLKAYWTEPGRTQTLVEVPVTEAMRGGFTVRVSQVRENRAYLHTTRFNVPWSQKNLDLSFAHFTDKLQPGAKETWTVTVKGPQAEKTAAEMVAALYDASLDAFAPHGWPGMNGIFRQDHSTASRHYANTAKQLENIWHNWGRAVGGSSRSYWQFPHEIVMNWYGYGYPDEECFDGVQSLGGAMPSGAPVPRASRARTKSLEFESDSMTNAAMAPPAPAMAMSEKKKDSANGDDAAGGAPQKQEAAAAAPTPNLDQVSARANLNETAFWFPQLLLDGKGEVKLEFTMPEALTTWNFLGFAHGQQCQSGMLTGKTVTQKDLMVQPNPPRFMREGDELSFTAKLTNMTDKPLAGKVRLTLVDANSGKSIDAAYGNKQTDLAFNLPAKGSQGVSWPLVVPDGAGVITYKVVAAADKVSDGEEGFLPILSRRIFVHEALPLPIRGPAKKSFAFTKLLDSAKSATLKHQALTLQVTSQPAWYAVQALPFLIEFPHECSEQTFNRLYANSLAAYIANSDPKIRKVFDTWKADEAQGGKALLSNLEKNEQLKSVLLLETPWVREAKSETEAKHKVGLLFDKNTLSYELGRAMSKLKNMQCHDGAWPWFPGGDADEFITLYIVTGFGRLRHLGVKVDVQPAVRALNYLDRWVDEMYRDILRHGHKDDNHLGSTIAIYLYGRSFFLDDQPIPGHAKEAVDYWLGQGRKYWLQLDCRMSQGHLALGMFRFGEREIPKKVAASLKERSVTDEELGRFWRDTELSYWWYRAPIETQAIMIEVFKEIAKDEAAVDECQVWLLKQKQTQDWKTSKATADAIYALLLQGANLLASDKLVTVSLGGVEIKPEKVEAGTGFYEQRWDGAAVKPEMGKIEMNKEDKGVAWGAVHWQYLEDMTKVTPAETNLKLKKTLFVKNTTKKGLELSPVSGPLQVGDLLTVRIELRTDRDMEYVHMKDQRGAGLEPTSVLSVWKYQDGLRYYEATKDTASHFYISYLPKGTYVFEYDLRVQHKGKYQTGMAEIQCMYAPEFCSHSESFLLEVK